jgi:hypothetical protein
MTSSEKPLNRMDRLSDMLHFPAAVNAGATLNVLVTILATWWIEPRYPLLAGPWIAVVLFLNLLPRLTLRPDSTYPVLAQMDFFRDQHKFSDWVYLAASADMAFWILLAWTLSAFLHTLPSLAVLLAVAAVATFSPVLMRTVKRA